MSAYPLPEIAHVSDLLGMLFDGLAVKPGAKLDLSANSTGFAGVYVNDDNKPVALCTCDIAFAANSSAALSMLPPNQAKEAIKSKALNDAMIANLHEVMNICTRLLLREGTAHLRLEKVYAIKALPPAAAAIVGAGARRIEFDVGIGRYGNGVMGLLVP